MHCSCVLLPSPSRATQQIKGADTRRLFLYAAQLLHVDGLHHLLAVGDRGLLECLTRAQFFNHAGAFKFTFEFLESTLDVLAFFYLYNNHIIFVFVLYFFAVSFTFSGAKLHITFDITKHSPAK